MHLLPGTARVKTRRLFFALRPPGALRRRLAGLAGELRLPSGARRVPEENLHLTLAFLGALDPARGALAEEAACGVRERGFVLELDRFGRWPRPRVLWTAPTRAPEALAGLVGALRAALADRGFPLDARGFAPHLTLARDVTEMRGAQDHPPVRWPVDAFHLVESATRPEGARYRLLRTFALGPPERVRPRAAGRRPGGGAQPLPPHDGRWGGARSGTPRGRS